MNELKWRCEENTTLKELYISTKSVKMYDGPKYSRIYKDALRLSTVIKPITMEYIYRRFSILRPGLVSEKYPFSAKIIGTK